VPYIYRRTLTINHEKVGVDNIGVIDSTSFPVVVELSGDWLKSVSYDAVNGRIESDNGYDIIFTTSGGDPLYHEVQAYSPSAGTLIAWVRFDSLSKYGLMII